MAATTTLIALDELRDYAAQVLAPVDDGDPNVFTDYVDALEPPALVLDWDDTWLQAGQQGVATMGPCLYTARLRVWLIAGRLEPGPGYRTLDQLAIYVLGRMRQDTYDWPLDRVNAGVQFSPGGVTYLAAAIVYAVPTTA